MSIDYQSNLPNESREELPPLSPEDYPAPNPQEVVAPWSSIELSGTVDLEIESLVRDLEGLDHPDELNTSMEKKARQAEAVAELTNRANEPVVAFQMVEIITGKPSIDWWAPDAIASVEAASQSGPDNLVAISMLGLLGSYHPVQDAARSVLGGTTDSCLVWHVNVELALSELRTPVRVLGTENAAIGIEEDTRLSTYDSAVTFLRDHNNHPLVLRRLLEKKEEGSGNIHVDIALEGTRSPLVIMRVKKQLERFIAGYNFRDVQYPAVEIYSPKILKGNTDPLLVNLVMRALTSNNLADTLGIMSLLPEALEGNMDAPVRQALCGCIVNTNPATSSARFWQQRTAAAVLKRGIEEDPESVKLLGPIVSESRPAAAWYIAGLNTSNSFSRSLLASRLLIDLTWRNLLDQIRFMTAGLLYNYDADAREIIDTACKSKEGSKLEFQARCYASSFLKGQE